MSTLCYIIGLRNDKKQTALSSGQQARRNKKKKGKKRKKRRESERKKQNLNRDRNRRERISDVFRTHDYSVWWLLSKMADLFTVLSQKVGLM